jgi:hypothetical protein
MSDESFNRRDLFKRAAAAGAGAALLNASVGTAEKAMAAETVPTTTLGSTGKTIPKLLMGCSQKFDPVYDKVLHTALKEGVNYLDSGQVYANGQSHATLGTFMEQIGDRSRFWVTSKVMLYGKRAIPANYTSNLEKMLPDLKTDYLDMFMMHDVRSLGQLGPDYMQMGRDLKKRGLIRHFGFSCHHNSVVDLLNKAAEIGPEDIDAIQFRYSFAKYGDKDLNKAIDACKKAGIGLIAMKTQDSVPDDKDMVKSFQSKNYNLFQAKLKAVWADERIDAAVSEMTNLRQLRENVAAVKNTTELAMHEFHQLNRFAANTAHHRCNGCSELCESRVEGDLKVADQLRFLMYDECYGKPEVAKALYRELSENERAFEELNLADATKACPQGIDIVKRLSLAKARLA